MADLKRQTQAVDTVKATEELTQCARHYSAMARKHMGVTFAARTQMATINIRHLNNFVKACVLDAAARAVAATASATATDADTGAVASESSAVLGAPRPRRGLTVVDIACGRGQDGPKFRYAAEAAGRRVSRYYALDLSAENVESATRMAATYLAEWAEVVDVRVGDMHDLAAYEFVPDGAAHIVTCQLALHYLFRDPEGLRLFFREVARMLHPCGLLVVSYTDGRAIVRRGRDAATPAAYDTLGTVTYRTRYYWFSVPAAHLRLRVPSPYGMQYVFTLPGSVEEVPEYLVHEGVLWQAATTQGLVGGASLGFDEAARLLFQQARFQTVAAKMKCDPGICDDAAAVDVASLYRVNLFAKDCGVLRAWDHCVNT
jgi:SAM-dependent methyltransferase